MVMPNRQIINGEPYRYNYQGQELDPEIGKVAFEARLYDPRINRWLTIDPAREFHSPYLAMGNNWARVIDPDGRCTTCPDNAKVGDTFEHTDYGTLTFTESGGWSNDTYGSILDDIVINTGQLQGIDLVYTPIKSLERNFFKEDIKTVVLHRTVSNTAESTMRYWRSKKRAAGTNFLIGKDGTIYQTASINRRTSHLYPTKKQMYPEWYGVYDNQNTIGIEVVGNYKDGKWDELPYKQVVAVHNLLNRLHNKYNMHNEQFFAHETLQRKTAGEGGTVIFALRVYRSMLEPNP
ncbi:MAG: hypothetical protein GKR88_15020 [Flavobacteriaceae bacterium]|nr:MAG: hypothetical protein GKR88_15020 [Flavobacteriaceae bacterium]